jgi:tetratricopeptide (TPR) repeat protein
MAIDRHARLAVLAVGALACGSWTTPSRAGAEIELVQIAPGPMAPGQSDRARDRAAALDRLFGELKAAGDEGAAQPIAAEIWRLWLESGDSAVDARMRLAMGYMSAGRAGEALATLDEIIARAPQWAEAWNKRATLLYMMDENDRSLADCFKVLELEPRHFGALSGMGLIGIAQGNFEAALKSYRKAAEIHPFIEGRKEIIPFLERKVGVSKI